MYTGSSSSTKYVMVFYTTLLLSLLLVVLFFPPGTSNMHQDAKYKQTWEDLSSIAFETGTEFIPSLTLRRWRKTNFLIVLGIPSEDIPARRRRRDLQRKTCWTYDGVARRDNNYSGPMLVLYALGRSALYNFEYSSDLKEEASKWHDIVALPLNEGVKSTSKKIGGDGHWGIDAEIGMSRKAYFWMYTANNLFPLATYIAKGDDDIFLRVPVYLATLRTLPTRGLYWGYGSTLFHGKEGSNMSRIYYTYGMCITLGADIVKQVLTYKPLRELVHTPYSEKLMSKFWSLRMDHEDAMLGVVLHYTGYTEVVYAWDKSCHLHNVYTGTPINRVTLNSMVIHHLKEEEYEIFMKLFENVEGPLTPRMSREGNLIRFYCRRGLPTLFPTS